MLETPLFILIPALIGYLIGAIPFGYIWVKLATGKDLRQVESGRTGGTNAYRAAGGKIAFLTSMCDVFKATVAVWLAGIVIAQLMVGTPAYHYARAIAGVCAVIGHNWSVYIGFRGGAGLTPNVGWVTAVWGWAFPLAFGLVLLAFYITGMASVMSFLVSLSLVVLLGVRYALGIDTSAAYLLASLVTLAMISWSLRSNFKRVLAGTERVMWSASKRKARKQ